MPWESSSQPTDAELQILRVLWEHGPSPVRVIHEAISRNKEINYSTTVKMLSVMLDKQMVKRDESVRPQLFRAAASQKKTQQKMLKDLVRRAYDGSAGSLVLHALASQKATPEELAEIRELLRQLEGGQE